jgi:hypothetical protein
MTTPTLTPAQAQEAVELLREFCDLKHWDISTRLDEVLCYYCDHWTGHADTCPIARAQALLAALEKEDE